MIRVLLVDDEQLAKDRLRQLLRPFEDVEVVGEAADGEQAMEQILRFSFAFHVRPSSTSTQLRKCCPWSVVTDRSP